MTLWEIFLERGVPGIVLILEEMYADYLKSRTQPVPVPPAPVTPVTPTEVTHG